MSLSRSIEALSPLTREIVSGAMDSGAENVAAVLRDSGPDVADVAVFLLDNRPDALRDLLAGYVTDINAISDDNLLTATKEAAEAIYSYYKDLPRAA